MNARTLPRDHRDLAADMGECVERLSHTDEPVDYDDAMRRSSDVRLSADAVNADRRLENEIRAENDAALGAVPIPGDIVRLRALLAQRSVLTVLEVDQLGFLVREALDRITTRHHKGLDSVNTLVGVLDEIGASPEVEDGIVHIACLSHADAMRIGGDLRQHAPQLADSIIDQSHYDKISGHIWWDCKSVERKAAA